MDFLCLDFINSLCKGGTDAGAEPLADGVWLRELCRRWNLPEPDDGAKTFLVKLRGAVHQAARELSETGAIAGEGLNALNVYLKPVMLHNLLESGPEGVRVRGVPHSGENTLFPYRVVMSFADLASNYEAGRLKICENPDCGWVFYDESKSRTRRWCDNTCASLIKVRRFRKKQASA